MSKEQFNLEKIIGIFIMLAGIWGILNVFIPSPIYQQFTTALSPTFLSIHLIIWIIVTIAGYAIYNQAV
jgi:hypothetical protein